MSFLQYNFINIHDDDTKPSTSTTHASNYTIKHCQQILKTPNIFLTKSFPSSTEILCFIFNASPINIYYTLTEAKATLSNGKCIAV